MNLSDRHYSKQSYVLVNAKYALTRNEIDLILTLLTEIKKEDKDFQDYIFSLKDLEFKTSKKWHSKQLKDTVKGLMNKPLEIKESPDKWEIINWFSYFKYDNGIITCRFDNRLNTLPSWYKKIGLFISDLRNDFTKSGSRLLLKRIYFITPKEFWPKIRGSRRRVSIFSWIFPKDPLFKGSPSKALRLIAAF